MTAETHFHEPMICFAVTGSSHLTAVSPTQHVAAAMTIGIVLSFTFCSHSETLESANRYDSGRVPCQSTRRIPRILLRQPVKTPDDVPCFIGRLGITQERQMLVADGPLVGQKLKVDHFIPVLAVIQDHGYRLHSIPVILYNRESSDKVVNVHV